MLAEQTLIVDCADLPEILPHLPLLTSDQAGWSGIQLAHHYQPAWELPEMAGSQHIVHIPYTSEPASVELVAEGHLQQIKFSPNEYADGCFGIIPASLSYKLCWDVDVEFVHCYLEPSFLARIAHETVHPDRVELTLEIKRVDLLIHQIGLALRANLALDGIGSRFYADSMATALSAHLLRHYATRKHHFREHEDGLSQYKLRQAIEYIQTHLGENLSLTAIADELGMSQYYFCRLFKQSIGLPPHQYLIQQRIERAKQLLKQPELTVTAVALECGFTNQSHFAKHFRQRTGITPKQFRQL